MRFARVPRVIRVCFWRGFRACCSARVPRATSHSNFLFLTTTTTATTSATTTTSTITTTTTATATSTRSINSTRGLRAYAFRAGSARYARSRVVAFKFLSSHCYYYYYDDDYYYYLLILEVLIVRAGSARMRFVRVPRVMRVCFSRGFRAYCSARVPRASSHSNFLFLTTTTTATTTTNTILIVRAGSARMRFARVPRVMRVCFSRGFRACCPHSNVLKMLIYYDEYYYYFY